MAELNCYITTFNCGRTEVNIDYFASSLFSNLESRQVPPDLILLSLQEIAPIGHSFLGGPFIASYFSCLKQAVTRATSWRFGKDVHYMPVRASHVGMTGLMVFAEESIKDRITWIEAAGTGVGVWEMGNKGAVGTRIGVRLGQESEEEMVLTFVAAHLAPMEPAWERRNEDWKNICKGLVFEPTTGKRAIDKPKGNASASASGGEETDPLLSQTDSPMAQQRQKPHGLFYPPSYVFFAGDLNYRASDIPPDANAFKTWPQLDGSESDSHRRSEFFARDQLTREHEHGRTLHHLAEAPVSFPPTYKYSTSASKLAEEQASHPTGSPLDDDADGKDPPFLGMEFPQEQGWLWAKHRVPSWCDRIFFLTTAPPTVHSYAALPVQPTSDHRPVALSFSLPQKALPSTQAVEPPFEIWDNWREKRAAARRGELLVGLGYYLGGTPSGRAVLFSTVLGIVILSYALRATI